MILLCYNASLGGQPLQSPCAGTSASEMLYAANLFKQRCNGLSKTVCIARIEQKLVWQGRLGLANLRLLVFEGGGKAEFGLQKGALLDGRA